MMGFFLPPEKQLRTFIPEITEYKIPPHSCSATLPSYALLNKIRVDIA